MAQLPGLPCSHASVLTTPPLHRSAATAEPLAHSHSSQVGSLKSFGNGLHSSSGRHISGGGSSSGGGGLSTFQAKGKRLFGSSPDLAASMPAHFHGHGRFAAGATAPMAAVGRRRIAPLERERSFNFERERSYNLVRRCCLPVLFLAFGCCLPCCLLCLIGGCVPGQHAGGWVVGHTAATLACLQAGSPPCPPLLPSSTAPLLLPTSSCARPAGHLHAHQHPHDAAPP